VTSAESQNTAVGFVLTHHAAVPRFQPLQLINHVTYLGRQPGNDVVLESVNVSRRHAKLIVTDLGVTAHDLDSHNGMFLNGKKVRSAPVRVGDLLYVGDICLKLERANDPNMTLADTGQTAIQNSDISDEADPPARALAALMRVVAVCGDDNDGWAMEAIQLCRELVEAIIAAFIEVDEDGELDTPIILQPEARVRGQSPVLWPIVQAAIADKRAIFSRDVVADGFVDREAGSQVVMVAPVMPRGDDQVRAVLYVARGQATSAFSEVEFEALRAIARVIAMRIERERSPAEVTNVGTDADVIATQVRVAGLQEELSAETAEVHRLTQRVHALEAENLTLKQQGELERHGQTKRENEREREAIAKLEAAIVEAKKQAQREVSSAQKEVASAQKEAAALTRRVDAAEAASKAAEDAARVANEEAAVALEAVEAAKLELAAQAREAGADLDAARAAADAATAAAAAAAESVAALERRAVDAEAALERTRAELAEVVAARDAAAARLELLEKASIDAADRADAGAKDALALRTAMRTSVIPTIADHVEAIAGGGSTTSIVSRPLTVVYLALADFDAWCERAGDAAVKAHLDAFCGAVAARATANGGRIDQVVGHGHLLVFDADAAGARAAVRCALEVAAVVAAEAADAGLAGAPSVVGGLDSGTGVAGFFGDADAVSYVEAGLPVVIARAAVDFAPKGAAGNAGGILVSEAIRVLLSGEQGFRMTRLDPSWIRGVNAPVQLALVDLDNGGAS
jgi:hypothetical protein